jgi:hypothetical protein
LSVEREDLAHRSAALELELSVELDEGGAETTGERRPER